MKTSNMDVDTAKGRAPETLDRCTVIQPLRPLVSQPLTRALASAERSNSQAIRQLDIVQGHLLSLLKVFGECVQILGGEMHKGKASSGSEASKDEEDKDNGDEDEEEEEEEDEEFGLNNGDDDAQDRFQEKFQEYVDLVSAIQVLLRRSFKNLSDLGILSTIGKSIPYRVTLREEAADVKEMYMVLADILAATKNYQAKYAIELESIE